LSVFASTCSVHRSFGFAFVPTIKHSCCTHTRRNLSDKTWADTSTVEEKQELLQKRRLALKRELIEWGQRTDRGFRANPDERSKIRKALFQLAALTPTEQPASPYFSVSVMNESTAEADEIDMAQDENEMRSSIKGKWTLIYTDAPDIIGLQSPSPLVELGNIGQECQPPTIANVIEWKAPSWVTNSPLIPTFLKGDAAIPPRILQKVVVKGTASRDSPSLVKLDVVGIKFEAPPHGENGDKRNFQESIAKNGLIAGLLEQTPLDVSGLFNAPFGEFEILYLDDEMRITRTGQNYFAINLRLRSEDDEWF